MRLTTVRARVRPFRWNNHRVPGGRRVETSTGGAGRHDRLVACPSHRDRRSGKPPAPRCRDAHTGLTRFQ
jgi:hypothetical protein